MQTQVSPATLQTTILGTQSKIYALPSAWDRKNMQNMQVRAIVIQNLQLIKCGSRFVEYLGEGTLTLHT